MRVACRAAGAGGRWSAAGALVVVVLATLVPDRESMAAGTVGNGSPASCTESALVARLAGGGAVTFNCGGAPKTISITTAKSISVDTAIDGGGVVTLDGAAATRFFNVAGGAGLTLANLALTNGSAGLGGAINSQGTLVVTNCTFTANTAAFSGLGAAIYTTGAATVTGSTFSNNSTAGYGGAIHNAGTLHVAMSVFSGNVASTGGGAIVNVGALVTVDRCAFDDNHSVGPGGAIQSAADLTITGTTFALNTAGTGGGGAIWNGKTVHVSGSAFTGNSLDQSFAYTRQGGAIWNDVGSQVTLDGATLDGNSAPGGSGGAIYNKALVTLTAVTLSANTAVTGGAAFNEMDADVSLTNSTVSGNAGGAVVSAGHVTSASSTWTANAGHDVVNQGVATLVAFENSVVADGCGGAVTSLGHNLDAGNSCGFAAAGDRPNTDALLGPLADNGGATKTHAVGAGSPTVDAGNGDCPATDQRGTSRPIDGNGDATAVCDVGAYEYAPAGVIPTTGSTTTTSISTMSGCTSEPTFASIDCRLTELIAAVRAGLPAGGIRDGVVRLLQKAAANVDRAASFLGQGKPGRPRYWLGKSAGTLKAVGTRLRSRRVRRVADPAALAARSDELKTAVATLRASL